MNRIELDHEAGQALLNKQKKKQLNNVINFEKAWMYKLDVNSHGRILNNRKNIQLIFENDENLKNIGRINEFSGHKEIYRTPIWRKKDDNQILWTDVDDAQLRTYLDTNYGISNESAINDVINIVFYKNSYHPIKEYLTGLTWDGTKRMETLFIDFLGAEDDKYSRTVTKIMLVGAVARIFHPGIKFDTALILIGSQGIGKSYVLSRLGRDWYNESVNSFSGDEALMKLRESWIVELAELSALKASEVEEVKAFISATVDTYRPKYSRNIAKFPRQCVFFGSTNSFEFLKDKTGNRRFLPLRVDKKKRTKDPFEELTDEYIDQVWAEAYQLYRNGEEIHITDPEVHKKAVELQNEHTADDGLQGVIEQYIEDKFLNKVCARQIWFECLGNTKEPKRHDISDINDVLRRLEGWKEKRMRFGKYGPQRGFIKINDDDIEI